MATFFPFLEFTVNLLTKNLSINNSSQALRSQNMDKSSNRSINTGINILVGTLILSFAALNTKFPLFFEKSSEYIQNGFTYRGMLTWDLYGMFVAHASWAKSLWLVIYLQAFLLALTIYWYFESFSSHTKWFRFYYFGYIVFVTFLMSGSLVASTISPMVLYGISFLSLGLLLFSGALSIHKRLAISLLTIITILTNQAVSISIFVMLSLVSLLIVITQTKSFKKNIGSVINILAINTVIIIFSVFICKQDGVLKKSTDTLSKVNLANSIKIPTKVYRRAITYSSNSKVMQTWFNDDIREFYLSGQVYKSANNNILNNCQLFISLLLIFNYTYILLYKRTIYKILILYILVILILNQLATLIFDYWQEGVWYLLWMLPLPLFLSLSSLKTKYVSAL